MGGRHIFMGYLNDPVRTSETINKEGFLCTGDVGHIDKYGFVYITGRIKVIYSDQSLKDKSNHSIILQLSFLDQFGLIQAI